MKEASDVTGCLKLRAQQGGSVAVCTLTRTRLWDKHKLHKKRFWKKKEGAPPPPPPTADPAPTSLSAGQAEQKEGCGAEPTASESDLAAFGLPEGFSTSSQEGKQKRKRRRVEPITAPARAAAAPPPQRGRAVVTTDWTLVADHDDYGWLKHWHSLRTSGAEGTTDNDDAYWIHFERYWRGETLTTETGVALAEDTRAVESIKGLYARMGLAVAVHRTPVDGVHIVFDDDDADGAYVYQAGPMVNDGTFETAHGRERGPDGQQGTAAPTPTPTATGSTVRDGHTISEVEDKYWQQRFRFFSRYNEGIRLDAESWYSVSPERIAEYTAERCRHDLVVDAFCGAGGNSIQFAMTCERVIAVDIDPRKIALARHNAAVYGVADRIEFIVGDFFEVGPSLKADVVFLSPPWGGPEYLQSTVFDVNTMMTPSARDLVECARGISPNLCLFMPRNSDAHQMVGLAGELPCELEQVFLNNKLKALNFYTGELATPPTE